MHIFAANQVSTRIVYKQKGNMKLSLFANKSRTDGDIGLQVDGELFKAPFGSYFVEYRAGVFNGSGLSMKDNNDANEGAAGYETICTVGAAYHIAPKTRIMFNYVHYNYKKDTSVNEIWAQLQLGF